MRDLSFLDALSSSDGAWVNFLDPRDGSQMPERVRVVCIDSERARQAEHQQTVDLTERARLNPEEEQVPPPVIAKLSAEFVARCTTDIEGVLDGKPLGSTLEELTAFYIRFPVLRAQALAHIKRRANFLPPLSAGPNSGAKPKVGSTKNSRTARRAAAS